MGNNITYLRQPVTDCHFENGKSDSFVFAVATVQGWRKKQEDAFKCIVNYYKDFSYFGVFDGHGGSEIAEFLKRRLHSEIEYYIAQGEDIELALHFGFLSCDLSLKEPKHIKELNAIIEEENDPVSRILKSQVAAELDEEGSGPSGENFNAQSDHSAGDDAAGSSSGKKRSQLFTEQSNSPGPSQAYFVPDKPMQVGVPESESLTCLLNEQLLPSESDSDDEDFDCEDEASDDLNEQNSDETDESDEMDEALESEIHSSTSFLQQEPGDYSGSTATVAILNQSKIYVANAGDSKCILSRGGKAVDVSVDHNPSNPEELIRIQNAGATVTSDGYINHLLNVSRAFGDFKLKGSSQIPSEQCVTAEPQIKTIDIEKDDDLLIIASDGIWNCFSSQELVDFINLRLKNPHCLLNDVCEEIMRFAIAPDLNNDGSGSDNMTLIIIKLNADEKDSSLIEDECMDISCSENSPEPQCSKEEKESTLQPDSEGSVSE